MALTLFGSALSPYVRACRVVLVEKGLDYDFVPIGPPDLQAPDYVKRHPFRKLPSLDVDGVALFETSAIMRYVDESFDSGVLLQPGNSLDRAHSEQWISASDSYLYPDLFTGLYFQRALAPQFGMPVDEGLVCESVRKTRNHMAILADALSAGTLGRELTLGDILVSAMLLPLQDIDEGQEILAEYKDVSNYLSTVAQRESFEKTKP